MKGLKKLASLLLAAVLAAGICMPAYAAGGESTLAIKTTAGHTYKVYQLLVGDVSGVADGSGTVANVKAGANLKAGTTVEQFVDAIAGKTDADLGDAAFSYVVGEPVATIVGDGAEKSVNVADGYYLITDAWTGDAVEGASLSRYMVAVVGDTTMTPKASTTSIDKKIVDTDANAAIDGEFQKTDTAAIGDEIEYEVTGQVPNMEGYKYYYYVVHDTMSKGLTLDQGSFAVTVGGKTLIKDTDYFVYFDEATNSFELALEDLKSFAANNEIMAGAAISVKYTATVNDQASIGLDPNTNTAKLEYSNNPGSSDRHDDTNKGTPGEGTATGEGPNLTTKTYVTQLSIIKTDDKGNRLEGAEFTLVGENLNKVIIKTGISFQEVAEGTGEYYKLKDGTYTKETPSAADEGQEGYNKDKYDTLTPDYIRVTTATTSTEAVGTPKQITAEVTADGTLVFTGLNAGDYVLKETKTPEGYNTIGDITFTISATQTGATGTAGGKITWASSDPSIISLDAANGVFSTTIVNKSGSVLPSTGGMGTMVFYAVGAVLVIGAAILLVVKRRSQTK